MEQLVQLVPGTNWTSCLMGLYSYVENDMIYRKKEMIKIKRNFIFAIILILLLSSISYGEGHGKIDEISYKNNLLKVENKNLRRGLLALRLALQAEKAEKIPVLLYHHIATKEEIETYGWEKNDSIVSLEKFSEQMLYLKENDFHTATLEELDLFIDGKIELPKNTLVISFDDGYLSNIQHAYPIMKSYGFKGSIFMVGETATRDESNLNPGELLHIPAGEIYKYRDVFEFGSHSFNMHSKNEENIPLMIASTKEEVVEDLAKNLELFSEKTFAYPYGAYDLNTIDYLRELGYRMAFTVQPGYVTRGSDKLQLPRISILPHISIEQFKNRITPKVNKIPPISQEI